jgi:hypothetical protein
MLLYNTVFIIAIFIIAIGALCVLAFALLSLLSFIEDRKEKRSAPKLSIPEAPVVCRFCRQEISSHDYHYRSCRGCRASLQAREESALTSLREAAPPLFEDIYSKPCRADGFFVRMFDPPEYRFGNNKPGETHTTSLREFMQYPTLHRERFIAALFSELSSPAELLEETIPGDVTRIVLANPQRTYRAHRPRSLGMDGVGRMDCYITTETSKRSKGAIYKVTVVHFVFARADDVPAYKSTHTSIDDAKREARQYLRKRYREIPSEHLGIVSDLLDDTPTDTVSLETAVGDLQRAGAALVGTSKARWLAELAVNWDGNLHKLIGYVRELESKKQVLLMINMMPAWGLSHRMLVQAVKGLEPYEPGGEVVSVS